MTEASKYGNEAIGERLKTFRKFFLNGQQITSSQLAGLLDEKPDRIRNYESGRSAIPIRLVVALDEIGLSMNYLLTGEGLIFSSSEKGIELKSELDKTLIDYPGRKTQNNNITRLAAGDLTKESKNIKRKS
ncbi:MAG: hypothetical protein Kapaf2KO_08580 [Candidatus Kapaibacteriales bacterium]